MNIKNLALLSVLLITLSTSLTVKAEGVTLEKCASIESISRMIMKGRQNGVSMAKMVKISNSDFSFQAIKMAYKEPLWSTKRNKEIAINKFADANYSLCLDLIK